MNKRNYKQSSPTPQYKIGDLVYFHAFADSKDESTYFLCKGYITRQPKPSSQVYKLVVISVDSKSVLCGNRPDIARKLLGRRIVRNPEQLSSTQGTFMQKCYGEDSWLNLSASELRKVKTSILRKCK